MGHCILVFIKYSQLVMTSQTLYIESAGALHKAQQDNRQCAYTVKPDKTLGNLLNSHIEERNASAYDPRRAGCVLGHSSF